MTFIMRYGSFELLVMPFGLCNAQIIFCNLMNDMLRSFLDKLMVVYLDGIVALNKNM